MFPALAGGSRMDGTGESSTAGTNQGWRKGWLAKLKHNHCLSERKPGGALAPLACITMLLESPEEAASSHSGSPMDHR